MTEKKRITIKNDDGTFKEIGGGRSESHEDENVSAEEAVRRLSKQHETPSTAATPYDPLIPETPEETKRLIDEADRKERERNGER